MHERKIYKDLTKHLEQKQVTVITGMRRVGKSTALAYLMDKTPIQNKIYLDLERIENQHIFLQHSYNDIERSLEVLGFDLSQQGMIALDEIQLVKNSSSVIKALYDKYGMKFIVTGSSSFYLKNHFSESLAGRKRIFEMYPLDFEEFLQFKDLDTTRIQQEKMNLYLPAYYDIYKGYYKEYLEFGGVPEVVLCKTNDDKIEFLKDILNSHIELDIKLLGDISSSDTLYKLILLLANRVGSKIDYTKIGSLLGINRLKVKEYILLLEYTYLIKSIKPFTKGFDKEITKQSKIYFTDSGLLQICGQKSGGAIFENAIANQLSVKGEVNYYEKSLGSEIDFVYNKKIAFEVKETPAEHDENSLKKRAQNLGLEYCLIGKQPAQGGFKNFIWGGNIF